MACAITLRTVVLTLMLVIVGCGDNGATGGEAGRRSRGVPPTGCPSAAALNKAMHLPTSAWRLLPGDALPSARRIEPATVRPEYLRGCGYRSDDGNSYLTLVFAHFGGSTVAGARSDELLKGERDCSYPSVCSDRTKSPARIVTGDGSWLAGGATSDGTDGYVNGAAHNGATLCLLPSNMPQRLRNGGGDVGPILQSGLDGLHGFLRGACSL